jgi:DNA-binding NarL/FixJ family response regulator
VDFGSENGEATMTHERCEPASAHPGAPQLTSREREVLCRLAEGQCTRQIAKALQITPATTRTHASNILMKLGVRSRVQAAATAGGDRELALTPEPVDDSENRPEPRLAETDPLAVLTHRERDVLTCIIAGLARIAIAERLRVSPNTVRTHARNILAKLGVHSTLEAAALVRSLNSPGSA